MNMGKQVIVVDPKEVERNKMIIETCELLKKKSKLKSKLSIEEVP